MPPTATNDAAPDVPAAPAAKVQGAQSFSRSMSVLQLVADSPTPPTVGDLQAAAGMTTPTLYRILSSLEFEGLVVKSADKRFRLGTRLVALAQRALAQNDLRDIAHGELVALRDATGETVHLAVPGGAEMIYFDKVESQQTVRMASSVGARVPFHASAVGKAYLSGLTPEESEARLAELTLAKITEHTSTSVAAVAAKVETARRDGYCEDVEENEIGIVCFGAPLIDAAGKPVAAISISVPTFRLDADKDRYWRPLVERCAVISRRLSGI